MLVNPAEKTEQRASAARNRRLQVLNTDSPQAAMRAKSQETSVQAPRLPAHHVIGTLFANIPGDSHRLIQATPIVRSAYRSPEVCQRSGRCKRFQNHTGCVPKPIPKSVPALTPLHRTSCRIVPHVALLCILAISFFILSPPARPLANYLTDASVHLLSKIGRNATLGGGMMTVAF